MTSTTTRPMPRRPRLSLPNTPLHLIRRGNNRQAFLSQPKGAEAFRFLLNFLADRRKSNVSAPFVLKGDKRHTWE